MTTQPILIACGDVDLLRRIVGDLPPEQFKPIATRKGAGIAGKLAGRNVRLAVVHEALEDDSATQLCEELRALDPAPEILFLASSPPQSGPFDIALRYPVPGPVLRNALKRLAPDEESEQDLRRWQAFHQELEVRLKAIEGQSYYEMFGLAPGAPHHHLVKRFDAFSLRYHPDRYNQHRGESWGQAIFDMSNQLYKAYTEAWAVLADRRLRQRYDGSLARGQKRLSADELNAASDAGPRSVADLGTSSSSKRFLRMAQSDIARHNWSGALQNLRFAASMEPENRAIAEKISEIEQKAT